MAVQTAPRAVPRRAKSGREAARLLLGTSQTAALPLGAPDTTRTPREPAMSNPAKIADQAPAPFDPILLEPGRLRSVRIDLTSNCNLRCVYCQRSQPGYTGQDMPPLLVNKIISQLKAQPGLEYVDVNGHGETTVHPNWKPICDSMLDAGFALRIGTNLAKHYSDAEIETLARFSGIVVSIDTADRELLRKLRRSVDLRSILHTITRIRAMALRLGTPPPAFGFSSGVYDLNARLLPDLARLAAVLGIKDAIFWKLRKYPDIPGALNIRPLTALPPDELARAIQGVDQAAAILQAYSINCIISGNYIDELRPDTPAAGATTAPAEPLTRNCADPWRHLEFRPDGSVRPCCDHPAIADIREESIDQIRHGNKLRKIRNSLLTATPNRHCQACPVRAKTTPKALLARFVA